MTMPMMPGNDDVECKLLEKIERRLAVLRLGYFEPAFPQALGHEGPQRRFVVDE